MVQSCQNNNIAVVGGGPSGIYFCLQLLKLLKEDNINNFSLTIFDNAPILRTILVTGNSRCNITNAQSDVDEFILNYPRGQKFLYSLFSKHFNYDSLEYFKSIGIDTYIQNDSRVFPITDSAKTVRDKMISELKKYKNVKIQNQKITDINELKTFDYIIIAAGSKNTESLIESTGHTLIPFKKALCALNIANSNRFPKGVSVKSPDGDFVFTPSGISGPLAFKIQSLNIDKELPYDIEINLFNYKDLINEIKLNPKKSIGNIISKFVARSLALVLADEKFNKKAAEVSKKELINYTKLNLRVVSYVSTGEIVNKGGVCLDELTKNCKSKINDKLWFCGEILNIDGLTGGFNLQNCWSSAYVAALDVFKKINLL